MTTLQKRPAASRVSENKLQTQSARSRFGIALRSALDNMGNPKQLSQGCAIHIAFDSLSASETPFSKWLNAAPKFGDKEEVTLNVTLSSEDWLTLQVDASNCKGGLQELVAIVLHGHAEMCRDGASMLSY
jgi:hypothetical protein